MLATWWRRNRWALLALPLVVLLAWAATSYRQLTYWNPTHLTEPVRAEGGGPVRLVQELEDTQGTSVVDLTVEAAPVRQVRTALDMDGQEVALPMRSGTVVWQVDLTVTADPATVLGGCALRLLDERGRETAYSPSTLGVSAPITPCVPAATPGPGADLGLGLEDEVAAARPETYTVPVLFRTAADFVPAELDLYYLEPRYAAIPLTVEEDRP